MHGQKIFESERPAISHQRLESGRGAHDHTKRLANQTHIHSVPRKGRVSKRTGDRKEVEFAYSHATFQFYPFFFHRERTTSSSAFNVEGLKTNVAPLVAGMTVSVRLAVLVVSPVAATSVTLRKPAAV